MTTTADDPATAAFAGVATPADIAVPAPAGVQLVPGAAGPVVTVVGPPDRRTASRLSCRLHEAIATASAGDELVVDLGAASAADPAIARVLLCARESAADRGFAFVVR